MHVFTYGTLMFPEVWQAVVGRDFASLRGHITGYHIYRVADAVFPGIVQCPPADDCLPPSPLPPPPSTSVAGVVYLDVDAESLARLDRFEDDFYDRGPVPVHCADSRQLEAAAYIVPDKNRHVLTDKPWTAEDFLAHGDLARFLARYAGFQRLD